VVTRKIKHLQKCFRAAGCFANVLFYGPRSYRRWVISCSTSDYLEYVGDERSDKHAVQLQRLIAEYIEQTTTTAVLGQDTHGARVNASSDERVEIIVTNFSNLHR